MDALSSLFKNFDFAALLPEMDTFLGRLEFFARLFVVLGPLILLCFGLKFYFFPAPTAEGFGFRSYYVTGSVEAWRFAQRLAGLSYLLSGGVLFVVMLIVSLFFGSMDGLKMATVAVVLICIQLLLVALLQLFINTRVLKFFDKDGNRK